MNKYCAKESLIDGIYKLKSQYSQHLSVKIYLRRLLTLSF